MELGIFGSAACVPGEHDRARAGGGLQARGVKAGGGEHPDRVDRSWMSGQPRRLGVGQEDRGLAAHCVAGASNADHRDGAGGFGRRQLQPGAEFSGVPGDGLVGPGGWASGAQHVGRQRRATPPMRDGGPAAELGRHGNVGDRGSDAGDGRQPSDERGAHACAFAERNVVVGADDLLSGDHSRGAGVAFDGRMGPQCRLEHHAAGHDEHGRGEQGNQRAGERTETAASAEDGKT